MKAKKKKKKKINSDHFLMSQVIHYGYYLYVFLKTISSRYLRKTTGREGGSPCLLLIAEALKNRQSQNNSRDGFILVEIFRTYH